MSDLVGNPEDRFSHNKAQLLLAEYVIVGTFLAHLSRRLRGELIVYQLSWRPSVRLFTFSNMNISETNGSIATKFYLKHYWGGGLAALGFWPDPNRTGFHGNRKLP